MTGKMNGAGAFADWIAVDWGSTDLRAVCLGADGSLLGEPASAEDMAGLQPEEFEPALLRLIGPFLAHGRVTPVIACGMVGAKQGWHEVSYRAVPARPLEAVGVSPVPGTDPRIALYILPGLSQAAPADVMRGEETQCAGFIADNPNWDGVLCLPGTHTKWAEVSAGEVVSFQTFMTGELFGLLSNQSVLRHGMSAEAGWNDAGFASGMADALSRPQTLAAYLFRLRAEMLIDGAQGDTQRARLSGLLIGAELAAARPYWLGRDVVVIGADEISRLYETALRDQGVPARSVSGRDMVLTGLMAAYATLAEKSWA
ncbi:MAG: 2-dehydro-3-deoxygalactonokinase [Albidovulum sp.]